MSMKEAVQLTPGATLESLLEMKGNCLLGTDQELLEAVVGGTRARIQTVNLHHLELAKRDPQFRVAIESATWVTADGWPVRRAFAALGYHANRVTGYDLVANLVADERTRSKSLGLLGASSSCANRFRQIAGEHGVRLVFSDQGRRDSWDIGLIVEELKRLEVDILLVAVTPPWGDLLAGEIHESGFQGAVIAVGGAIDIVTGQQSKGPGLVGKLGLVWLYRMMREPRRLFTRYIFRCLPVMVFDIIPIEVSAKASRLRRVRNHQGQ